MSYETIVVHLDCGKCRSERLDLAVRVAAEFDARLIGLFALDLYAGLPAAADAGSILVEAELQRREACMSEAQAEFLGKCATRSVKAQWQFTEDDAAKEVALAARCADLVVIGQTDPTTRAEDGVCASFAADVVLTAGKPVLIVPYAGHFEGIGKRTLVAWNAAPEAKRALMDALPVLERSQAVEVVSFEEGGDHLDPDENDRLAVHAYLQGHGVNATVRRYFAEDFPPGELILSQALDDHADCIVMGAYGQPREKGTMLGGATRTVMNFMTVPVIMSH
jgi:nucleotide-binding universal stress UspA family protein